MLACKLNEHHIKLLCSEWQRENNKNEWRRPRNNAVCCSVDIMGYIRRWNSPKLLLFRCFVSTKHIYSMPAMVRLHRHDSSSLRTTTFLPAAHCGCKQYAYCVCVQFICPQRISSHLHIHTYIHTKTGEDDFCTFSSIFIRNPNPCLTSNNSNDNNNHAADSSISYISYSLQV